MNSTNEIQLIELTIVSSDWDSLSSEKEVLHRNGAWTSSGIPAHVSLNFVEHNCKKGLYQILNLKKERRSLSSVLSEPSSHHVPWKKISTLGSFVLLLK